MILSVFSLMAQEAPYILSLDSCISMALTNNRKAVTARNNIDEAVSMKREAFTKYFPEIAAGGVAFWANHDIIQYNLLNIIELGMINRGKLAGVQAVQPVFMGGQIVNGNKLAGVGEDVAELRRQQTDNELRLTTEEMYWKLVTLKATRLTLTDGIATLDSLKKEVKTAVEAGVALNNDLLKVEIKRNSYLSELIDVENGITLMKMLLGQYVGLGISGNIEVLGEVPDEIPALPQNMYMATEEALPATTDYRLLQKNVEAKSLEKRMEIGSHLPSVAFGAGWYYHDLFDQNHNFGALQIIVDIPLSGWWGGGYAIKRKDIALATAKIELEDLSEQIRIGIRDKWNNLTAAQRKMGIEKESVAQSEENLRLNRMYYEAGMSTISDLLDAETEVQKARSRYIASYGEYRSACAAYMIATGR